MSVAAIDFGLLFAVLALGWGIALAVYRTVAEAVRWPMGRIQRSYPELAFAIGVACVACSAAFALWRAVAGYPVSASMILLFGIAWAVFWIGFLRVAAQSALLLAPLGTLLLLWRWLL